MEHDPSRESGYATNISSSNSIENLLERYVPINDFLRRPTDEMLDLDVAYRICMQQLMAAKRMLRRKNLSKRNVNDLLDRIENELAIAQRIAFWKRDVLLSIDKKLFTLTGRKSKPKIEKVVVSKPKVRNKKTAAAAVKESLRRSERERKSPCIVKAKESKEITTTLVTTTPESNVQLTCRTKRKAKESESGADSGSTSSSTKKRTSGRLAKPGNRKKQLTNTALATNTSTPATTDEPTYCLCEQISFGEMIGCDNEKCLVEWFHFECVQLKVKPKGKWYCPMCRGDRFNVLKSSLAR